MTLSRRAFGASLASTALVPGALCAQEDSIYRAMWGLVFGTQQDFLDALVLIRETGGLDLVPGLIQAMRFARAPATIFEAVLVEITGENPGQGWFNWMLWQERHPEIVPHPSYAQFKRDVYLRIDPNFDQFLRMEYLDRAKMKIRLEEVTWGGVIKDGIPSLDNPKLISAAEATYLKDDDLVFGVSINGDARAYPLRIMGWHEMFNDVIGGVPLALAYCTLCGSGILFETQLPGRAEPMVFGSSGFLYRSNKLMFDRGTNSLWNQFTGQPVIGPLADSGITLTQRPVAIDTWANWRRDNPATKVLSLDTGFQRDYGPGVVYNDYFASPDLMFPTIVDQTRHAQKDYVFGIRQFGGAKAWPLEAFAETQVINDGMLDTPLVLIGDAKTRTVRAYQRGALEFAKEMDGLTSGGGKLWTVTEDALLGPGGETLPRVAGHIAYWFAWNGYLASESEIYEPG